MTQIDINTFIGGYPFRDIGENEAADLIRAMARIGTDRAWVSHLGAMYWRDPTAGNATLFAMHERHHQLTPIPAVHPGLPHWRHVVSEAAARGLPAVRCDPGVYGIATDGVEVRSLVQAAGACDLAVMMAVRIEDVRQRHPNDRTSDLTPAAIRHLIRSDHRARLIVTHADREFIEQVHFGSTPDEAGRLLWDICWIWGPPEDHLALLLETVGRGRFTFGTGTPLRLGEATCAKIDLLNPAASLRSQLSSGNLAAFLSAPNVREASVRKV